MMIKVKSEIVDRLIAETLGDGERLRQSAGATDADRQITQALASGKPDYEYEVSSGLFSSSNMHGRIACAEAFGARPYGVNLKDCWKEVCLGARYREQSTLNHARQASSLDALYAQCNVRWLPVEIAILASAVSKLYLLSDRAEAVALVPLFELFDRRMDVTFLNPSIEDAEGYDVSVCVSLLIGRDCASIDRLESLLGRIPIFKGVSDFWGDDQAFKRFTQRAAQWHADFSIPRSTQFWAFASVAPEILFPSWILALDKFRQEQFGRPSSIGDHELLAAGQAILNFAKSQSYPQIAALVAAERRYEQKFGSSSALDLSYWSAMLTP